MPPSAVPDPVTETASARHRFDPRIVACYLYPITRYGYPPPADGTERYVEELAGLGFRSSESGVADLDRAYVDAATLVEGRLQPAERLVAGGAPA